MADDRERFERIYRENVRAVLRFAATRIDPERAKDVASETFLVAWRRLDEVPVEERPWLLGVARRIIADQFRAETRRQALAIRLRATHDGDKPADLAGALANRDEALAAFATLRERDREVLRLVTWDGLSAAEAADVLAVSRLTFTVRLHRARRRLQRALEPNSQLSASQKTRRREADAHS